MQCEYCNGNKTILWKDDTNCAFVDSYGEMMVVSNDKTIRFKVNNCPMCGRKFTTSTFINMKPNDDIWYVDDERGCIEHGAVFSVQLTKDGKHVDSFSVDFDDGDFDEFNGNALGKNYFLAKEAAKAELRARGVSVE